MARHQGGDQRQQRLQAGGQVDVHVGDHVGVAGPPDLAEGPAAALVGQMDGANAGSRWASRLASGQVASVLALSAMVTRNGKLADR